MHGKKFRSSLLPCSVSNKKVVDCMQNLEVSIPTQQLLWFQTYEWVQGFALQIKFAKRSQQSMHTTVLVLHVSGETIHQMVVWL